MSKKRILELFELAKAAKDGKALRGVLNELNAELDELYPEEVVYLITHQNGKERRITVPDDWKVTFGPAAAGVDKKAYGGGTVPLALRFYEKGDRQRAIFTDVASFRDLSIKMEVKKVDVQEKQGYAKMDGAEQAMTFQVKRETWVNEDEPVDGTKLLPELAETAEAGNCKPFPNLEDFK